MAAADTYLIDKHLTFRREEHWLFCSGISCIRASSFRRLLNVIESALVHITRPLQNKLSAVRLSRTVVEGPRIRSSDVVDNRLRAVERDRRTAHEQPKIRRRPLQPEAQIVLVGVWIRVDGTLARLFVVDDGKAQIGVRAARFRHRFRRVAPRHCVGADVVARVGVALARVESALFAGAGVFLRLRARRAAVRAFWIALGFQVCGRVAGCALGAAGRVPTHAVRSCLTCQAGFAFVQACGRCSGDEGGRD